MRVFTSLLMALGKLFAWFKGLPCIILNGLNLHVRDYIVYGNSEQKIEGFDYTNYTPVEYAENDTLLRVKTGVIPTNNNAEFYTRFYCASSSSSLYLLLSRSDEQTSIFGLSGSLTDGTITLSACGSTLTSDISRTVGHIYQVRGRVNGTVTELYVKDETTGVEATNTGTITYTAPTAQICLLGDDKLDYTTAGFKIYEAYYKEGSEYKFHYYPAKNDVPKVGFYDVVASLFKLPVIGTFTAGSTLPTPTVPIEVKSVGDKTKNLFTREYLTDYYHLSPATGLPVAVQMDRCAILEPIDVTNNNNVTVSYSTITGTATYMCSLFNGDTLIERVINKTSGSSIDVSAGNKLYLSFYTTLKENLQNIQVEDGTTATSYEPYGYKVPVIASGKNLCITGNTTQTINGVTCTLNGDGTWNINGTASETFNLPISSTLASRATIPLEANTSYTLSGITDGLGSTYILRCTYTKNGATDLATVTTEPFTFATVETTNAVVFFRVFSGTTFNNLKIYPQIEKGSSYTSYEPYHAPTTTNIMLTRPLPKLGSGIDSINYKNQTWTMGTSYYEFDGTETFSSTYSATFGYTFTCSNILSGVQTTATSTDMLCTHFRNNGTAYDIKFSFTYGTDINFNCKTTWTSTSDFKTWLASQKSAGTPVTVYYPLQTPITIGVTTPTGGVELPSLTPYKGTTYFTVDTEVQPFVDSTIKGMEIECRTGQGSSVNPTTGELTTSGSVNTSTGELTGTGTINNDTWEL